MTTNLVTGGSGFLGRHLVRALCARGEAVRVLDTVPFDELPGLVESVPGSILDANALERAMRGAGRVFHLAGIASLWTVDKADFDTVNAKGTELVLRAAIEAGVRRLVHCSTEAILLPNAKRRRAEIDESLEPSYQDMPGPYTRSKYRAEQAVRAAVGRALDAVIVNPTVPVGADDRNLTPPAAMIAMFLDGASPAYLDCVLNLVDADDVASGMILAAERGRAGERYILGGDNVPLRDLLSKLEALSGRRMPRVAVPGFLALGSAAIAEWIADRMTHRSPKATLEGVRLALRSAPITSRKAQAELGFAPRPIDQALERAVRWLSAAKSE